MCMFFAVFHEHVGVVVADVSLALDFYSSVKLVNYVRSEVRNGNLKPDVSSKDLFQDDKYLQPVLQEDALLIQLDDLINREQKRSDGERARTGPAAYPEEEQDAFPRAAELEKQLQLLQSQFADYRLMVQRTLDDRWNDTTEASGSTPATNSSLALEGAKRPKDTSTEQGYFDSYSYNGTLG